MDHRDSRKSILLTLVGGAVLFALNCYISQKLYAIEYLHHMHSIEPAYISIARYAMENWRDLGWWPLWYGGIPYQNTYPPLLHLTVAAFAKGTGLSPALSFHAVNAFLYCLGPVALYWMALQISGLRAYSFLAGLLYSLVSPSALLISHVRQDIGSTLYARRLHTLVFYGDGPFVSALTLVPIAILCLHVALRRRRPLFYLLAALAMASVVLTNWLGGSVLGMAVLAYLFGMGHELGFRAWPAALGVALLAYLLASPWIPPSTLNTIRTNAQTIGGDYQMAWKHVIYAAVLGATVLLLHFLFRKFRAPGYLRVSVYFFLFAGGVTLMAEWFDVFLLPQPHRYHLAMEMAVCLSAAFLVKLFFDRVPRTARTVTALVALLLCLSQARTYRRFAGELIQPIDIQTTTEYKTAQWFDRNMNGRRVMAPGSTTYFLNIFTDTPQLGGGFEQGNMNWENRIAVYTIYSGQNAGELDGEISVLWLKAFGVHAVAVSGPNSGEYYKPFRNPRKFVGLLPELSRENDDYIYAVPSRTDSLAHVVRRSDLVNKAPIHGLDVDQVRRYVAALDDASLPEAEMRWTSRHSARIVAELNGEQVISAQVTYHPGWRAEVNGVPGRVRGDKIGLMVIETECEGRCVIDLFYNGGMEMQVARALSLACLGGMLLWAAVERRRRARRTSGRQGS